MSPAKKVALSVVVSAVLMALIVHLVGARETLQAAGQVGWGAFGALGGLLAAMLALQAGAWAMLNRTIDHHVPYRTLLAATTVGLAGNILTPSTYLGGEPAKVLYVGHRRGLSYQQLAGTVLLAKYLEALSFLLFLAGGTAVAVVAMREVLFGGPTAVLGVTAVVVVAAALGAFGGLWVSLARRWTPLTHLVAGIARLGIFRRFFRGLRGKTMRMERQASRVFREEGRMVLPAFGLFVLTHVAIYVKPLLFFWLGWRVRLGPGELGLIFLTCQVLLAFQLTPSGVGTLDGGLFGMLAVTGIPIAAPQCAAFLLCLRFWDAAVVAAGAVLAARAGADLLTGRTGMTEEAQTQNERSDSSD